MKKLFCGFLLCLTGLSVSADILKNYVEQFNKDDDELYAQYIPNIKAEEFLRKNIPLFECPDKDIEKTYYYRWWTFRKHIKNTPDGFIITEFLPKVPWAGKHNAIVCPAWHHFLEGRWLADKTFLADYARHWVANPVDARRYSSWNAHANLEYYKVSRNIELLKEIYPALKEDFFAWEKEKFNADKGLFWQADNLDGMELSISGRYAKNEWKANGYRATINSYMYGNCIALSEIAKLLGNDNDAKFFKNRALQIKEAINTKLWDNSARFYKVIPFELQKFSDVRELHGYTPWLFNIPPTEYSDAWKQLTDTKGFSAKWGLTTAEQRHPNFQILYARGRGGICRWDGPVWPFATSITLEALANFINNYPECSWANKDVYYDVLKTYARSHVHTLENGKKVMWIDENQDPYSGVWVARKRMIDFKSKNYIKERGKDYNHSQFCNHIISGLVGVRPTMNGFEFCPLIPDNWQWFSLKNIKIADKTIDIIYDKTGSKYGKKGLQIFVDNKVVVSTKVLQKANIYITK